RRPAPAGRGRTGGRLRRRARRHARRARRLCPRAGRGHAGDPRLALAPRRSGPAMSGGLILALNAGSSSVKFGVYETDASGAPRPAARGTLETGARPRLRAKAPDGTVLCDEAMPGRSLTAGIEGLLRWIGEAFPHRGLVACGHRIVHGGGAFADPVRLTPPAVEAIDRLTP